MRDFTTHPAMRTFPWESVLLGMAVSEKTVNTYNVGEIHQHGMQRVPYQIRPTDKRWYLALKYGWKIEGFNVHVTDARQLPMPWFATADPTQWIPSRNAPHFAELLNWIKASGIFKCTGRITFFVTLPGQEAPLHRDFVQHASDQLPADFVPPDCLWITDPNNPKHLRVSDVRAPWACSFDTCAEHCTLPSTQVQWSLRIDGVFA